MVSAKNTMGVKNSKESNPDESSPRLLFCISGGTYLNEARETKDATGLRMDHNWAMPRSRINSAYYGAARYNTRIIFPEAETAESMTNFDNCETRAAMCCWTQDRQANDDNGNCAEPYDEDCVDADPADNTDVCYVDLERSPQSNRVENGLTVFDGEQEGDVHCHGFAWSNNANEPSALFKGANLFYVSMYDHLGQRGYVRNVPGAPMCGCVEQVRRHVIPLVLTDEQFTNLSFIRCRLFLVPTVPRLNLSSNGQDTLSSLVLD